MSFHGRSEKHKESDMKTYYSLIPLILVFLVLSADLFAQ